MYDAVTGVEAFIQGWEPSETRNTESQYPEYEAPRGSPFYKACSRVRYIEAITNQRYQMVVILHPQFSFGRHTHVKISYEIDGGTHKGREFLSCSKRKHGECMEDMANAFNSYINGTWERVGFTFAELSPNEGIELSKDEEEAEVERRGNIKITVQRGKAVERDVEDEEHWDDALSVMPLQETTKAVAINHGKSHSFGRLFVDNGERPQTTWDFQPAGGKWGVPIEFTFYYTSRMILEMKKILPETPALPRSASGSSHNIVSNSPTIGKELISPDDGDDEENVLAKTIKAEPVDHIGIASVITVPSSVSARTVQNPKIKPEPQDDPIVLSEPENEVAFVGSRSRKRRRKTAPIETINLCDDDEVAPSMVIKAEAAGGNRSNIMNALSSAAISVDHITNINMGSQDHQAISLASNVVSTGSVVRGTRKSASKAKEKELINLQLEEIKLKKRLIELEGDDAE